MARRVKVGNLSDIVRRMRGRGWRKSPIARLREAAREVRYARTGRAR